MSPLGIAVRIFVEASGWPQNARTLASSRVRRSSGDGKRATSRWCTCCSRAASRSPAVIVCAWKPACPSRLTLAGGGGWVSRAASIAASWKARRRRTCRSTVRSERPIQRDLPVDERQQVGAIGRREDVGDHRLEAADGVRIGQDAIAPGGARRALQREPAGEAHEAIGRSEQRVEVADGREALRGRRLPHPHQRLGGAPLHQRAQVLQPGGGDGGGLRALDARGEHRGGADVGVGLAHQVGEQRHRRRRAVALQHVDRLGPILAAGRSIAGQRLEAARPSVAEIGLRPGHRGVAPARERLRLAHRGEQRRQLRGRRPRPL